MVASGVVEAVLLGVVLLGIVELGVSEVVLLAVEVVTGARRASTWWPRAGSVVPGGDDPAHAASPTAMTAAVDDAGPHVHAQRCVAVSMTVER